MSLIVIHVLGDFVFLTPITILTMPPLFQLHCATSGGPTAVVFWTRNDGNITENNATFEATFIIVDYIDATYNHTLTVSENFTGTYTLHVQNPFSQEYLNNSRDIKLEGKH